MKAKLGIAFEELRGKAGNSVGKMSNQGQILMIRSIGKDPKVQSQIRSRQLLTLLARRWAALTQEQRDGWNTAAGLKRSGYDLFCEYNTNLNSVSSAFRDDYNTPRALEYQTDIKVEVKPSEEKLIFTVQGTIGQSGFKLLIKISVFSPRLMSNDSYRYVNLTTIPFQTVSSVNAYGLVIGRADLNVQEGYYFKTEYYVIDTYSGARVLGGGDTLQWQDTEQPYIPDASIVIDASKSNYNASSETGEIEGSYSISNFNSSKAATISTEIMIWNDITKTDRFLWQDVAVNETLKASDILYKELDGGGFEDTWNKGVTKYVEFLSTIKVTDTGATYNYTSELVGITAS